MLIVTDISKGGSGNMGRIDMVRKKCGRCDNVSYSLSDKGRWICPACGEDLTEAPVMRLDRSTANVIPMQCSELEPHDFN